MICFYRYQEMYFSECRLMLVEMRFPVIRTTRKGTWIDVNGRERFVLAAARKRYACPTPEEALVSYYARKRQQIKILRAQLRRAEAAVTLRAKNEIVYDNLESL